MKLIIDSNETIPLVFEMSDNLNEVVTKKLNVGDYVAEYSDGSRCPIIFERKGLGDLFGTSTKGYKRFKRELNRAKTQNIKLILAIEGNVSDVLNGYKYSAFDGLSMLKKLSTMWLKYDLVPMFFDTRESMATFIREFYEAFGRLYKGKK